MAEITESEKSKAWLSVDDDQLTNLDKVVKFLQEEFCPKDVDPIWSEKCFRWKLDNANPGGRGYISIAIENEHVVGCASLTRKRIIVDGKECIGGEVGDTYTSARMRRSGHPMNLSPFDDNPNSYVNKSIFGRLVTAVTNRAAVDGISIIYGTPNDNSYPGYVRKLNYFDFNQCCVRSFVRPSHNLFFRRFPALKTILAILRIAELLLTIAHRGIYNHALCRGLTFESGIPSNVELDGLWTRLKPNKGIALVRDSSYWRHRYLEHPIAKYTFFSIRKHGCLAGVITTRQFTNFGEKQLLSIAEWMIDAEIPFGYALSNIVHQYRHSGVEAFNFWCEISEPESKSAARNLFFPRSRVPVILADTPEARAIQAMAATFQFYLGSSDNV